MLFIYSLGMHVATEHLVKTSVFKTWHDHMLDITKLIYTA